MNRFIELFGGKRPNPDYDKELEKIVKHYDRNIVIDREIFKTIFITVKEQLESLDETIEQFQFVRGDWGEIDRIRNKISALASLLQKTKILEKSQLSSIQAGLTSVRRQLSAFNGAEVDSFNSIESEMNPYHTSNNVRLPSSNHMDSETIKSANIEDALRKYKNILLQIVRCIDDFLDEK